MGGFGSGLWDRDDRKRLVENTLCLDINYLARRQLLTTEPAPIGWRTNSDMVRARVCIGENPREPMLFLLDDGGEMLGGIPLQSTEQRLGGRRWWLCCCLCGRRAAKLYQPRGEVNWGCRTCYRLTYRSCREAHRGERLRASLTKWLLREDDEEQ